MIRFFTFVFFCLLSVPAYAAYQAEPGATLRWLDKVTARTGIVEIKNGESAQYGDLVIRVMGCRTQDPLDGSDSAAFVQIWESKKSADPKWVYSGWMFSSSPGLASMDHPVYDVWVLGCLGRPAAPAQATQEKASDLPVVSGDETPVATDEETSQEEGVAPAAIEEEVIEDTQAQTVEEEPSVEEEVTTDTQAQDVPAEENPAPEDTTTGAEPETSSETDWDAPYKGYRHLQ